MSDSDLSIFSSLGDDALSLYVVFSLPDGKTKNAETESAFETLINIVTRKQATKLRYVLPEINTNEKYSLVFSTSNMLALREAHAILRIMQLDNSVNAGARIESVGYIATVAADALPTSYLAVVTQTTTSAPINKQKLQVSELVETFCCLQVTGLDTAISEKDFESFFIKTYPGFKFCEAIGVISSLKQIVISDPKTLFFLTDKNKTKAGAPYGRLFVALPLRYAQSAAIAVQVKKFLLRYGLNGNRLGVELITPRQFITVLNAKRS